MSLSWLPLRHIPPGSYTQKQPAHIVNLQIPIFGNSLWINEFKPNPVTHSLLATYPPMNAMSYSSGLKEL